MKKHTMRRGVLSRPSNVWFENLEARRLMSAALPTVSVTARQASASEIDAATTGMGQYMITRSGSTAEALNVDYHLWSGDTAKSGVDFEAVSGVLKIAAGKSYGYVDIVPIQTKTSEPQRSVKIVLDSGSYTISKDTAQVLIGAYSPANAAALSTGSVSGSEPVVSVTARLAAASEVDPTTSGMGQYMITRTGSTTKALTVDYYLWSGDTAKSGTDFEAVSGVLKIAAGRSYGYVDIYPIVTKTAEPQRSVKIVLDSGSFTISKDTAQILIAAYSPTPPAPILPTVSIVASKSDASESDPTGTGEGTYTITRTGSTAAALTVAYSIVGSSTAVAGTNYQPLSGSVMIAAGQSSATITLTPIDDQTIDAGTTVSLALSSSGSYTINSSQNSATITIANADVAPADPDTVSISATQPWASELDPTGTGEGVYTVTRSGPDSDALTVDYHVDSASTAVAGTSFQVLSGTVTFAAGQDSATIDLVPIDDGVADSGKQVIVDLNSRYNYSVDSGAASATIVIANADIDANPQVVTPDQLPAPEPINNLNIAVPGYVNLATEPLYHAGGPSPDDVAQGFVGDCAFLATISEIARIDPAAITNAIHQNIDGTYDVIFANELANPNSQWPTYSGSTVDIHIDGWLPVQDSLQQWSTMTYARLGSGDATWVAILEKAFAVYSSGTQSPSYAVANEGQWAGDCFRLFGVSTLTEYLEGTPASWSFQGVNMVSINSATDMANLIAADVAAGKAVVLGTEGTGVSGPLIADHDYSVISVTTDSSGNEMITLQNPWGTIDGINAYSTVSAQVLWNQMADIVSAAV